MKKIVVITGSPRHGGNSAELADAFVRRAGERGHTVVRYDAAEMNVDGCIACDACYTTGRACRFDDDFNDLARAIEAADAVVFSTPLYWYTFPAKLKAVIDKFYALYNGGRGVGDRECALIVCCADGAEETEGLRFAYGRTVELMGWRSIGEVMVPHVESPGDVRKTDGLARAEALAEAF